MLAESLRVALPALALEPRRDIDHAQADKGHSDANHEQRDSIVSQLHADSSSRFGEGEVLIGSDWASRGA